MRRYALGTAPVYSLQRFQSERALEGDPPVATDIDVYFCDPHSP
jgi:hypothetical protein